LTQKQGTGWKNKIVTVVYCLVTSVDARHLGASLSKQQNTTSVI